MTIDYPVDHAAFEDAIVEWLGTYATLNDRIRAAGQMAVRPERPYATYQIIADGAMEGQDAEHTEYNEATERIDVATYGPRRMTVQVIVFTEAGVEDQQGRSARIRLSRALAVLRSPSVKELFRDAGLAFLQVLSAPRGADEQLGDRWERRMLVDVEFGYTSLVTDKSVGSEGGLSWIETVEDINVTYEE